MLKHMRRCPWLALGVTLNQTLDQSSDQAGKQSIDRSINQPKIAVRGAHAPPAPPLARPRTHRGGAGRLQRPVPVQGAVQEAVQGGAGCGSTGAVHGAVRVAGAVQGVSVQGEV